MLDGGRACDAPCASQQWTLCSAADEGNGKPSAAGADAPIAAESKAAMQACGCIVPSPPLDSKP